MAGRSPVRAAEHVEEPLDLRRQRARTSPASRRGPSPGPSLRAARRRPRPPSPRRRVACSSACGPPGRGRPASPSRIAPSISDRSGGQSARKVVDQLAEQLRVAADPFEPLRGRREATGWRRRRVSAGRRRRRAGATAWIARSRSASRIGLLTNPSMPEARQRSRSSFIARAVMATIGVCRPVPASRCADQPGRLEAVHVLHVEVHEDEVEPAGLDRGERLRRRRRRRSPRGPSS